MPYDFIAIGDTVTDAFIRLKEASVHCDVNREECQICMSFGDKIPYDDVWVLPAVGNSANAAVSAARLGLKSALVTNIGGDAQGREALARLGEENVGTEYVAVHPDRKTNYHYVLWYEDDRTILIKHEEYPYGLPEMGEPKWIYLSSLADHAESFHDVIADYIEKHPAIKLAFQPGTFQMKLGKDRLARLYARTEVFFCNRQEAERILGMPENTDLKALMQGLRALGPKVVVVTDGPLGAYVYEEDRFWQMPIYPDPKPPYERTGAGDAFASTFTAALAMGLSITEALRWGPVNSMSVVQQVGAQKGLLGVEGIKEWLAKAPADYQPKQI